MEPSYYPLFIGEIKKQGTNDKRLSEGKTKQSQGNAAGDRVAKNYNIIGDFCWLCDRTFYPYNVFLHGFDFSDEEISKTTKSKLMPFFGELNTFNPYFEDICGNHKGGSCYYQKDMFSFDQIYDICYRCCEAGLRNYFDRFGVKVDLEDSGEIFNIG